MTISAAVLGPLPSDRRPGFAGLAADRSEPDPLGLAGWARVDAGARCCARFRVDLGASARPVFAERAVSAAAGHHGRDGSTEEAHATRADLTPQDCRSFGPGTARSANSEIAGQLSSARARSNGT